MGKTKTGTREWAEVSKNICKHCKNGCVYCYAQANALRFKQIADKSEWLKMTINTAKLNERAVKVKGRIMFPTSHDIVPEFLPQTIEWLGRWLEAGNDFLIVSKPNLECIRTICNTFGEYKDNIVFRFTIGSMHDDVLSLWEPNAPGFEERFRCLKYAYDNGFTTSVSCEPYLDSHISYLVELLLPYINDTIWIGKMNKASQRVDTKGWSEQDKLYLWMVEDSQTDDAIWQVYKQFKNNPKVKWKDSIKKVMGLPEEEVG